MKDNNNNFFIGLFTIGFLTSVILSIVSFIVLIVHAVKQPELTLTQNMLWFCLETGWWIPIVIMIFSYGVIFFLYENDIKNQIS